MVTGLVDIGNRRTPAQCESLPGYLFLERLGQSVVAEVWKVQTPDGRLRAAKLIHGWLKDPDPSSPTSVPTILKEIRHPALVAVEEVKNDGGRVVLITELADQSLRERFLECRGRGREGVPRHELLGYLMSAAEGLDYVARRYRLYHLGLNPSNLVLLNGQLLVDDHGLLQVLWTSDGRKVAGFDPRYAAPELFEEGLNSASDQYSLALIYQEMLTGQLPHRWQSIRQLVDARLRGRSDLDSLPGPDRAIVARALDRDPKKRFSSCLELMQALAAHDGPVHLDQDSRHRIILPRVQPVDRQPAAMVPITAIDQVVSELVHASARSQGVDPCRAIRYEFGDDGILHHRCMAWLPSELVPHKIGGFARATHAQLIQETETSLVLRLPVARSLWRLMWPSRGPCLELEIQLQPREQGSHRLTEVHVQLKATGTSGRRGPDLLRALAPILLQQLRTHLLALPERRIQERFRFEQPLRVLLPTSAGTPEAVYCLGKNISMGGISFLAPFDLSASRLYVCHVAEPQAPAVQLPAVVVRNHILADGWVEVGARFLLDSTEPIDP